MCVFIRRLCASQTRKFKIVRKNVHLAIEVCSEVRKAVEAGIKQVTSDINYVNAQHA